MIKTRPYRLEWDRTNNGCLIVTSHQASNNEYIQLCRRGGSRRSRSILLHRVIYEGVNGPIPPGLVIRHTCDQKKCISPYRLEMGTYQDNSNDMVERGRSCQGVDRKATKLSEEQVREIRDNPGKLKDLAKLYGVSHHNIWKIKHRETWGWLG